jgi:hypothetical protein
MIGHLSLALMLRMSYKEWDNLHCDELAPGILIYYAKMVTTEEKPNEAKSAAHIHRIHDDDPMMMRERIFQSVDECMSFFDERYYKVIIGGKTVVMERTGNLDDNQKKTDFYDAHTNKVIHIVAPKGMQIIDAAKHWFHNTNEMYKTVTFNPDPSYKPRKDTINTWMGFAFQPEKNGKADKYLQFVHDIICGGNQEHYYYLLDVMAQMVQEPHNKQGVGIAIALRGRQGVGKSFFVQNFGKLFGNSYIEIDSVEPITGRFNGILMNKILVFGDEAIWGGDKVNRNILKGLITSSEINVEKKFKDTFSAKNYSRFFFATNSDWSAPVERGNRRFFVLDVSSEHMRDTDYFKAIKDDLDNGGYKDLLYFLKDRDHSSRDFQSSLPITDATVDNLLNGLSPLESWLLHILAQNKLDNYDTGSGLSQSYVAVERFYKDYCEYVGSGYKERREVFGRQLKRIFSFERKQTLNNAERKWVYFFPTIEKAREDFENHIGVELEWGEFINEYFAS